MEPARDNEREFLAIVLLSQEYNNIVPDDLKISLVKNTELDKVVAANKAYRSVFLKLKPIFESLGGQTDIMSAIPQLLPLVQGLGNDQELKKDLTTILSTL